VEKRHENAQTAKAESVYTYIYSIYMGASIVANCAAFI